MGTMLIRVVRDYISQLKRFHANARSFLLSTIITGLSIQRLHADL